MNILELARWHTNPRLFDSPHPMHHMLKAVSWVSYCQSNYRLCQYDYEVHQRDSMNTVRCLYLTLLNTYSYSSLWQ